MLKEDYLAPDLIINLFSLLNENEIDYVLLRNIDDELPHRLSHLKDIDIVVNPLHKKKIVSVLKNAGWFKVNHPWDFGNNFVFLYSMDKFLMFSKQGVNVDICFQVCCRSLNAGEWIPLDEAIQHSVFMNKLKVEGKPWIYQLSVEDEVIHLITRCVFDKRKFPEGYINRINELLPICDVSLLKQHLKLIFFKFADPLMEMIFEGNFQNIRLNYLTFIKY